MHNQSLATLFFHADYLPFKHLDIVTADIALGLSQAMALQVEVLVPTVDELSQYIDALATLTLFDNGKKLHFQAVVTEVHSHQAEARAGMKLVRFVLQDKVNARLNSTLTASFVCRDKCQAIEDYLCFFGLRLGHDFKVELSLPAPLDEVLAVVNEPAAEYFHQQLALWGLYYTHAYEAGSAYLLISDTLDNLTQQAEKQFNLQAPLKLNWHPLSGQSQPLRDSAFEIVEHKVSQAREIIVTDLTPGETRVFEDRYKPGRGLGTKHCFGIKEARHIYQESNDLPNSVTIKAMQANFLPGLRVELKQKNLAGSFYRVSHLSIVLNQAQDDKANTSRMQSELHLIELKQVSTQPLANRQMIGFLTGHIESQNTLYPDLNEQGNLSLRLDSAEQIGCRQSARAKSATSARGLELQNIRLASHFTGVDKGWHLPLADDTEVLVDFLNGLPSRPVILGALCNSDSKTVVNQHNCEQHRLNSVSGNQLLIDDGANAIELSTNDRQLCLRLDKNKKNVSLSTEQGAMDITAADTMLNTANTHHLQADDTIKIKTEKESQIDVKHGLLETQSKQATTLISHGEIAISAAEIDAKTNAKLLVEGGNSVIKTKKIMLSAKKQLAFNSAKHLVIKATDTITLQCGASQISLDNSGIHFSANEVTLDAPAISGSGASSNTGGNETTPHLAEAITLNSLLTAKPQTVKPLALMGEKIDSYRAINLIQATTNEAVTQSLASMAKLAFAEEEEEEEEQVSYIEQTETAKRVKVRLKRFADSASEIIKPLRVGYIYLYLNGHFHKEYEIDEQSNLTEVILASEKSKDKRPAAGMSVTELDLPIEVEGKAIKIEACYSEVQWSWQQCMSFGPLSVKEEGCQQASTIGKAERARRLQEFKLNKLADYDVPNKATISGSLAFTAKIDDTLTIHFFDPLSIAEANAKDYHDTISDLVALHGTTHYGEYGLAKMIDGIRAADKRSKIEERHSVQSVIDHQRLDEALREGKGWEEKLTRRCAKALEIHLGWLKGIRQAANTIDVAFSDYFLNTPQLYLNGLRLWTALTQYFNGTQSKRYLNDVFDEVEPIGKYFVEHLTPAVQSAIEQELNDPQVLASTLPTIFKKEKVFELIGASTSTAQGFMIHLLGSKITKDPNSLRLVIERLSFYIKNNTLALKTLAVNKVFPMMSEMKAINGWHFPHKGSRWLAMQTIRQATIDEKIIPFSKNTLFSLQEGRGIFLLGLLSVFNLAHAKSVLDDKLVLEGKSGMDRRDAWIALGNAVAASSSFVANVYLEGKNRYISIPEGRSSSIAAALGKDDLISVAQEAEVNAEKVLGRGSSKLPMALEIVAILSLISTSGVNLVDDIQNRESNKVMKLDAATIGVNLYGLIASGSLDTMIEAFGFSDFIGGLVIGGMGGWAVLAVTTMGALALGFYREYIKQTDLQLAIRQSYFGINYTEDKLHAAPAQWFEEYQPARAMNESEVDAQYRGKAQKIVLSNDDALEWHESNKSQQRIAAALYDYKVSGNVFDITHEKKVRFRDRNNPIAAFRGQFVELGFDLSYFSITQSTLPFTLHFYKAYPSEIKSRLLGQPAQGDKVIASKDTHFKVEKSAGGIIKKLIVYYYLDHNVWYYNTDSKYRSHVERYHTLVVESQLDIQGDGTIVIPSRAHKKHLIVPLYGDLISDKPNINYSKVTKILADSLQSEEC